jgi:hypothetical protein
MMGWSGSGTASPGLLFAIVCMVTMLWTMSHGPHGSHAPHGFHMARTAKNRTGCRAPLRAPRTHLRKEPFGPINAGRADQHGSHRVRERRRS